ncbi:hypothetical protein MTO96_018612 [Rhipicephalus appendiculatus]
MPSKSVECNVFVGDFMVPMCAASRLKKVQEKKKAQRALREAELAKLQPKTMTKAEEDHPRNILLEDSGDEDILFT